MSLQLVSVIGNATKDAERKSSKDGVSYVTFRLAANNTDDSTTFFNVVVFGSYGEILRDKITKGREIFVSGKLQVSDKGYVSVIANNVALLRLPISKSQKKEENEEVKGEKKK